MKCLWSIHLTYLNGKKNQIEKNYFVIFYFVFHAFPILSFVAFSVRNRFSLNEIYFHSISNADSAFASSYYLALIYFIPVATSDA